ncbi:spore gernimation protein GerPD [Bacillus sp. RG28]|uniref:Spore gernimation protein GerPD n=1 Tax=Gottfriedia endophytica TaxID=2820819 RepID=A0A940NTG3_9BACI|nr:spore gernimation protein GerPD [Gottfriedia endophytica]MBP0724558.1 spore gernimation protein GerPD [Gottfriedia endophytica]
MKFNVTNHQLCVNDIHLLSVTSSSLVLIGDACNILLSSEFDTPPEALIAGPFVPLAVI